MHFPSFLPIFIKNQKGKIMLQKLTSGGNDKVVAFRWEGKFDKKAFDQSMVQFLPELRSRDRMNLYLEVKGIEGVGAKAIWEDIKFSVMNMNEIREKIHKLAVVSDKDWIRLLSETYKFIPGIKFKSFTFDESDQAILWINE